jgi:multidrug efflux pump subunit AcrA (membrane-fusion protein)
MKRFILPIIGVVAALWAAYSMARTTPRRHATNPPAAAPVSEFSKTIAAVGLIEANSENIAVGTPLPGVVDRIFVSVGQSVKIGDPLFVLDTRGSARMRSGGLAVSRSGVRVARAHLRIYSETSISQKG